MRKNILTLITLLVLTGQAWGATYYVSPSGSNTAPYDTWAKAATTITTILSAYDLGAGDVILASGTITEPSGVALHTSNDDGVKIQGFPAVTINCSGFTYGLRVSGKTDLAFENVTITNAVNGLYTNGNINGLSATGLTFGTGVTSAVVFDTGSLGTATFDTLAITATGAGITIGSSTASIVMNNLTVNSVGNYGVWINSATFSGSLTLDGFLIQGFPSHGISTSSTAVTAITIKNGDIIGNGNDVTTGTNWSGININGTPNVNVDNVKIS
jgi:hypothetical protein